MTFVSKAAAEIKTTVYHILRKKEHEVTSNKSTNSFTVSVTSALGLDVVRGPPVVPHWCTQDDGLVETRIRYLTDTNQIREFTADV